MWLGSHWSHSMHNANLFSSNHASNIAILSATSELIPWKQRVKKANRWLLWCFTHVCDDRMKNVWKWLFRDFPGNTGLKFICSSHLCPILPHTHTRPPTIVFFCEWHTNNINWFVAAYTILSLHSSRQCVSYWIPMRFSYAIPFFPSVWTE